jgi:hypothetical protein
MEFYIDMAVSDRCLKTFFAKNYKDFIFDENDIPFDVYEVRTIYLNTCEKTVTIGKRSGEVIELTSLHNSIGKRNARSYNQCVSMLDNMMRQRGLYVIIDSSAVGDTYKSFYASIRYQANSYIPNDLSHFQNSVYRVGKGPRGFTTNSNKGVKPFLRTFDQWINCGSDIPYSWCIAYYIPEDEIPKYDSLYVQNLDIVITFEDQWCIMDHPFSRKAIEKTLNNPMYDKTNSPKILFIDRTGVLGNLFMRTVTGCRLIHPVENPDPNLEDGIWLDDVWYDINKPRENQVKRIYIPYEDTETLAKYGLYYTYSEAIESEKMKYEFEKNKYKEQYQKEKNVNNEMKLKEYSKVLGYVAAIATAFIPLAVKLFNNKN